MSTTITLPDNFIGNLCLTTNEGIFYSLIKVVTGVVTFQEDSPHDDVPKVVGWDVLELSNWMNALVHRGVHVF